MLYIRMADLCIRIENKYDHVVRLCRGYTVEPTEDVDMAVSVTDEQGTVLPDCDAHIYVDKLNTEVLGIANGDPNGTQPNIAYDIKLFHGRAQIIVTAGSKAVTVRTSGLESATV